MPVPVKPPAESLCGDFVQAMDPTSSARVPGGHAAHFSKAADNVAALYVFSGHGVHFLLWWILPAPSFSTYVPGRQGVHDPPEVVGTSPAAHAGGDANSNALTLICL